MNKLEAIQKKASEKIYVRMSERVFKIEQVQPKPSLEQNQISELEEKLSELSQNFYIRVQSDILK